MVGEKKRVIVRCIKKAKNSDNQQSSSSTLKIYSIQIINAMGLIKEGLFHLIEFNGSFFIKKPVIACFYTDSFIVEKQ